MRWPGWFAAVALLGLVGCEASFPHPMTGAEVAHLASGDALVAYLAQPDASLGVCNPKSRGPHLLQLDRDTAAALVRGLDDGKIDLALGQKCIERALENGSPEVGASVIDEVGRPGQPGAGRSHRPTGRRSHRGGGDAARLSERARFLAPTG